MKVAQIYSVLNSVMKDILGEVQYVIDGSAFDPETGIPYTKDTAGATPSYFVAEDLSNIVDVGKRLIPDGSIATGDYISNVYASLINHIGRVVYVDRVYKPLVASVMKNAWEYGSIMEKIDADMPDSVENVKWKLENGVEYKQDTFHAPKNVRSKFFNNAVTYEIEMSFTTEQLKQSFSNVTQLNSFFSMIETKISNRMTINLANLTRATINSFIAATVFSDYHDGYNSANGRYDFAVVSGNKTRCINLLKKYKAEIVGASQDLTPAQAMKTPEFIRYAVLQLSLYSKRMEDISTLFNIGGKERFTPTDKKHLIMLAEFEKAADVYLQSDTFHDEYTKLPKGESVNFWQGTGADYDFENTSRIHTVGFLPKYDADGNFTEEYYSNKESDISGIIAVMFDDDALGINNEKRKVTSHYNAKGDFVNNFYKNFSQHFNDNDENFLVFIVA